jgi:hypothetical protein
MLSFFIVCFVQVKRVDTSAAFCPIGSFGFEPNGTFDVQFRSVSGSNLMFCLFTKDEFELYPVTNFPVLGLCGGKMDFPTLCVKLSANVTGWHGQISDPGIYHPVILNCDDPDAVPIATKVVVVETLLNPSTHMDIRWQGVIAAKWSIIIGAAVLLVAWLSNWIIYFHIQIHLHYMLTITFIVYFASLLIRYRELKRLDWDDTGIGLTVLRVGADLACVILSGIMLVNAAKGWCILIGCTSCYDSVLSTSFGLVAMILWMLPKWFDLGNFELASVMLAMLSAGLFVREVILRISDSSTRVWLHMLVILNAGIDPRTTPIFRKHKIFCITELALISFSALCFVRLCINLFVNIAFWIDEVVQDSLSLAFFIALGISFSLTEYDDSGIYGYIAQNEEGDQSPLALQSLSPSSSEMVPGGIAWRPGMWLPGEPTFPGDHHGIMRTRSREGSIGAGFRHELCLDERSQVTDE